MPVGYLGPPGSFTQAALAGLDVPPHESVPYPSVRQALDAVRAGAVDGAVVPWENSVEGSVTASVDALSHGDLCITGETLLRVEFALGVPAGGSLDSVRRVLTHPHAHAQCSAWLHRELPHAEVINSASTARAAQEVGSSAGPGEAAIAAPQALLDNGLDIAAQDIGARQDAMTRFVRISRRRAPAPPTGADRSSLIVPMTGRVGELHIVLAEFARWSIPLTSVLSRPGGAGFGDYSFLLECEGHISEPSVGAVVTALHQRNSRTMFLGSYPRAHSPHMSVPR
ncbi:prephenate dehydratase [Streptomyces luteolus]|uniref:prephenate dehydratase n=1 Tax=Streptomyces luteolus TaxID=3043615 RepID=A0ABT6T2K6_9ACTN|nr:prephenate dehydratase [Streptomyces sp. B-S-A12]MDI3422103.1 prephenate dehydratase [Streptomyces sp. B-S-A12]